MTDALNAPPMNAPAWSEQQRATFYYQMTAVQKDEVLGVLLALFLGSFGLHHFYLKQNGLGILYCVFFWTGLPGLIGFFEAFFMPGRVRRYNAAQASLIAASLGPAGSVYVPSAARAGVACPACGTMAEPGAKFCAKCGSAVFA
jgi:TM2 domain-containing membrane protein YozV